MSELGVVIVRASSVNRGVQNHSEAQTLSEGGQKVMNAIQNARFPVVAAINGSCLGGGLELALAW